MASLRRVGRAFGPLVGWQHPFYTAFFGIGLAIARLSKNIGAKVSAPVIGLGFAILAHFLHNVLTSLFPSVAGIAFTTLLDWVGWLFMLGFIFVVMLLEGRDIRKYLQEEVNQKTLTQSQFEVVVSPLKVNLARIKALFQGHYRKTTHFYRQAAELALKKKQLQKFGDERGNSEAVKALRQEVKELSKIIQSAN